MGIWFEKALAASTITGWTLCALGMLGLFGIWRIYVLQRTKMRELDIGEAESLRAAFVGEMTALRAEISGLREENAGLRAEVRQLHGIIDGMRRQNLQAGNSAARAVAEALPEEIIPPATRAALERIKGTGE